MRECEAVRTTSADDPFRQPAQDLGQDDAAVATRAHQPAVRQCLRDPRQAPLRSLEHLRMLQGDLHRDQHVAAGVAVRDREDVEGVHLRGVAVEGRHGRDDRAVERGPITEAKGHRAMV